MSTIDKCLKETSNYSAEDAKFMRNLYYDMLK